MDLVLTSVSKPITSVVAFLGVYGVNRNLLVSNVDMDMLAGVPRLNGMLVSIVAV